MNTVTPLAESSGNEEAASAVTSQEIARELESNLDRLVSSDHLVGFVVYTNQLKNLNNMEGDVMKRSMWKECLWNYIIFSLQEANELTPWIKL
jgi:hypothetical protein